MENTGSKAPHFAERKPWESLGRTFVGNIAEVVQGGGGKLSPTSNDSGDAGKPKGQG